MRTTTITCLLTCLAIFSGCNTSSTTDRIDNAIVKQQTVKGIGAGQGLAVIEDSVWLYGDNTKGVIRRMEWAGPDAEGGPMLIDTRETYELILFRPNFVGPDKKTKLDANPIPHPTGLTHHPDFGTFIGNAVNQQGTIYHIFWEGFTESGNLDDWVKNQTIDDLATNGTRPEFVRYDGKWLIATADYGNKGNKLRLYDPKLLAKAQKTSDPGVLVAEFDCGPFVQSMHWIEESNTLVLAQNQTEGKGYRLTVLKFADGPEAPTVERVIDFDNPKDELEGFAIVAPGWAALTSSSKKNNVTLIRWPIIADD